MNTSAISSSPAMQLVNSQLSAVVAHKNIAIALADKQSKVSNEVAQAALKLLQDAAQMTPSSTKNQGIDVLV